MVGWGMRPLDAMVAATANGAELLRMPEVGTVDEGKLADLVLYDADPVEDLTTLRAPRGVEGRPARPVVEGAARAQGLGDPRHALDQLRPAGDAASSSLESAASPSRASGPVAGGPCRGPAGPSRWPARGRLARRPGRVRGARGRRARDRRRAATSWEPPRPRPPRARRSRSGRRTRPPRARTAGEGRRRGRRPPCAGDVRGGGPPSGAGRRRPRPLALGKFALTRSSALCLALICLA